MVRTTEELLQLPLKNTTKKLQTLSEVFTTDHYMDGRMNRMESTTTIRIKRSTKQKLNDVGQKGMTYDDIINELLKKWDE